MLTSNKIPHLARVRQEEAEEEQRRALQDQSEVDDLSAQLFALTVTDDGPNESSHTNKLWTSRAELQASFHPPTPEVYPSLDDITDCLQRLAPFNEPSHIYDPPMRPNRAQIQRKSKREKHRATVVAHSTLAAIASKAATCKQSLSLPPSQPLLQKVESELGCLRRALGKVSRDVPTVNVRKEEVRETLDKIDDQLIELRYLFPKLDQGPVAYHTG